MSIEIKNLSFSYSKRKILNSISETFPSGKLSVIAGPNGSGKSTLVKNIMTLVKSPRNSVFINSKDILSFSDINRAKLIGYVSQSLSLDFDFSVYEIVEMGRYPYKKDWDLESDRKAIEKALELTNTENLKHRSITTLSGGELQRVLLARAICGNPKYLVLDEPVSNLDIKHNIEMMELIKKLTLELGITTVMILHDLKTISCYADKVVFLKDGKIFASGKAKDVLTPDIIRQVYDINHSPIFDAMFSLGE